MSHTRSMSQALRAMTSILLLGIAVPAFAQQTRVVVRRPLIVIPEAKLPVHLESVKVSTEIVGNVAKTALDLVFENPNARVLVGELQFPLVYGQTVSGFALDVDG